jgi:hypothetical protein
MPATTRATPSIPANSQTSSVVSADGIASSITARISSGGSAETPAAATISSRNTTSRLR